MKSINTNDPVLKVYNSAIEMARFARKLDDDNMHALADIIDSRLRQNSFRLSQTNFEELNKDINTNPHNSWGLKGDMKTFPKSMNNAEKVYISQAESAYIRYFYDMAKDPKNAQYNLEQIRTSVLNHAAQNQSQEFVDFLKTEISNINPPRSTPVPVNPAPPTTIGPSHSSGDMFQAAGGGTGTNTSLTTVTPPL